MHDQLTALTDPYVAAFERFQWEMDPYAPVAAWVAAYTMYVIETPAEVRREVAAGSDVLVAMTIPARIAAAHLSGDGDAGAALEALVRSLGPVSARIALLGGIESLVKTRANCDGSAVALAGLELSPWLCQALAAPFDLAGGGAPTFLAGVVAGVDDAAGATIETGRVLAALLEALYGHEVALGAVRDHAARWPTMRWFTADGRRSDQP